MPPLAIAAALIGGGVASGIAGNRKKKVEQQQQPFWDESFSPLRDDLLSSVRKRMANPLEAASPFKHAINRRFQGIPERVATGLAKRGFGKSGQLGTGLKGVEFARNDAMSELEGRIDQSTLDLALQLLQTGRGSTGSTTYPGNMLGGGISGGLSGLGGAFGMGLFNKKPTAWV